MSALDIFKCFVSLDVNQNCWVADQARKIDLGIELLADLRLRLDLELTTAPSRPPQSVASPTPSSPSPSSVPPINGVSGSTNDDLRIPLREIVLATNNFSQQNLIDKDDFEEFYKAQLFRSGQLVNVVVQRLRHGHPYMSFPEGRYDVLRTIYYDLGVNRINMVSIVGFCDENDEIIIINEHLVNGSLDKHLPYPTLTWLQRLHICVGVAHAINHDLIGMSRYMINVKSSKILLDKDWEPKLLATFSRSKHDLVESFGLLMAEVLCDRKKMAGDGYRSQDQYPFKDHYDYARGIMNEIIDHNLRKQMHPQSLTIFSRTAINCLTEPREKQHKIGDILKELERALELQKEHENAAVEPLTFSWKKLECLKIQLNDILLSTKNFAKEYCIGSGAYGTVYKAELDHFDRKNMLPEGENKSELPKTRGIVAIKRISNVEDDQGEQGFFIELEMLSRCEHPNIISLLGFSHEGHERILVYEYASQRSLDDYLGSTDKKTNLTWAQRIRICLDIAHGLNYLHNNTEEKPRIIHRDIKSANILLGDKWNAKIADFGLSKFHPMNQHASTINTNNIAGTSVYLDPEYLETGKLKKSSDIYSFGVVLFEILSGRLAYDSIYLADNDKGLASVARQHFKDGTLKELVDPTMREVDELISTLSKGPNQDSLDTFSNVAYRCLAETQNERPTLDVIIKELENALIFQEHRKDNFKFSLNEIKSGTNSFSDNNCIIRGAFGKAYKGEVQYDHWRKTVVAKRLSKSTREDYFLTELEILFKHKNDNLVGLLGYCKEMNEKIIVYDHESIGSLDMYLNNVSLGWTKRLKICIDVASGLDFLHGDLLKEEVVIHKDLKSASILLNGDWEAKISDFGLSLIDPVNKKMDHVVDDVIGTPGYYSELGFLTKESDIYALGVVLVEVVCGRLTLDIRNDKGQYLDDFVQDYFERGSFDEIVFKGIEQQVVPESLNTFMKIAYKCLHRRRHKRPTAGEVVEQLNKALEFQEDYEIWEPKLPRDYKQMLNMSKSPAMYTMETKKGLYNILRSKGILLQKGRLWFSLGNDGERIEMISSTMFSYKNSQSHCWVHVPESRFHKVAMMSDISNLKIQIKIKTQSLSMGISYRVHLVFKFCSPRKPSAKRMYVNLKFKKGNETLHSYFATWREDGWMMIELGQLSTQKGDNDFEVLLESVSRYYSGSGAIYVEGIECQAIDNASLKNTIWFIPDSFVYTLELCVVDAKHEDIKMLEKTTNSKTNLVQQLPNNCEETSNKFKNYDDGEKLLSLDNVSRKETLMLLAKEVLYTSSNEKLFDLNRSVESRSEDVVEVLPQQVFRIKCKIECQMLSPDTDYVCYLVFKISKKCHGLNCPVRVRDILHWKNKETKVLFFRSPNPLDQHDANWVPEQRPDGFMEVIVWKFNSNYNCRNNCIPMNIKLIAYEGTMSGLIAYGLEI
ncbi:hypothetical protein OSB04_000918 [Centaurea solstitialis]|uniref:non-specific serine/threonine protein kinase n=1 Tax=Centaurea solstitialis TaxID=347529 RepID=A0AA38WL85_9ASTR|nr:hypothetical protein OSB04_000918 [Centaurea solstitialis]